SAATSASTPSSGGSWATGFQAGDGRCWTTDPTPTSATRTPNATRRRAALAPSGTAVPDGAGRARRAATTIAQPATTNAMLVHVLDGSAQGVPPASSHAASTSPPAGRGRRHVQGASPRTGV